MLNVFVSIKINKISLCTFINYARITRICYISLQSVNYIPAINKQVMCPCDVHKI